MPLTSAPDIVSRYAGEHEQIRSYVSLVSQVFKIDSIKIIEINSALEQAGLPQIASRTGNRILQPYSQDELRQLLASLDAADAPIQEYATQQQNETRRFAELAGDDPQDNIGYFDRWTDHFFQVYSDGRLNQDQIQKYLEQMIKTFPITRFRDMFDELQDIYDAPPDAAELERRTAFLGKASLKAQRRVASRTSQEYFAILDQFDWMRSAATLMSEQTSVNVHRQAFLSLTTAFDAAIFDLVRFAIDRDFFKLIGEFGRNDKISLKSFAEYDSAEQFRAQVIEGQLKNVYIRELFVSLRRLNVQLTEDPDDFPRLMEIVLRRNVHIHNRGIVDEGYLERCDFNIDSLKLGDPAPITPTYWELAARLFSDCVLHVAQWAEGQPASNQATRSPVPPSE